MPETVRRDYVTQRSNQPVDGQGPKTFSKGGPNSSTLKTARGHAVKDKTLPNSFKTTAHGRNSNR